MGKKNAAILALALVLFVRIPVYAYSVDDIYTCYGLSPSKDLPSDIESTIKEYNEALRFLSMYSCVDLSAPDYTEHKKILEELSQDIKVTEEKLRTSFDRDFSEIISLEEELVHLMSEYVRVSSTMEYVPVSINIPGADEVPTYEEYHEAMLRKDEYLSSKIVSSQKTLNYPVFAPCRVESHSQIQTVVGFEGEAIAVSTFNGTVESVSDDSVVISTFEDITVTYSNMTKVSVSVGDVVKANEEIGYAYDTIFVQLKVRDRDYDFYKLFEDEK